MWVEAIGYLASALVLATFSMRDMVALRWVALASNAAFIAYGTLAGVSPVLALHLMLLPVNLVRLAQSLRSPGRGRRLDQRACYRYSRKISYRRPLLPVETTRANVRAGHATGAGSLGATAPSARRASVTCGR